MAAPANRTREEDSVDALGLCDAGNTRDLDCLGVLCVSPAAAVKLELDGNGLKSEGYTKNMPVTIDCEEIV